MLNGKFMLYCITFGVNFVDIDKNLFDVIRFKKCLT